MNAKVEKKQRARRTNGKGPRIPVPEKTIKAWNEKMESLLKEKEVTINSIYWGICATIQRDKLVVVDAIEKKSATQTVIDGIDRYFKVDKQPAA